MLNFRNSETTNERNENMLTKKRQICLTIKYDKLIVKNIRHNQNK